MFLMKPSRRFALLPLLLALCAGPVWAGVLDQLDALAKPEKLAGQRDFLPPDQAFVLSERAAADGSLLLNWVIEPGYYRANIQSRGRSAGQQCRINGRFK